MSKNSNGLITKIWGPPAWEFLHSVSFGYPLEPDEQKKKEYKSFFENIGYIFYPVNFVEKIHIKNLLKKKGTLLDNKVLENRHTLTKWLYDLHERINKKLKISYITKYNDLIDRYESYRSKCGKIDKRKKGCVTPADLKSNSFKISNYKSCPIISDKIANKFINYAKSRGSTNEELKYVSKCNQNGL